MIGRQACTGAGLEIGLELHQRQMLPMLRLVQERPALVRTERRGLTMQRGDRAIAADVSRMAFPLISMFSPPELAANFATNFPLGARDFAWDGFPKS